MVEKITDLSKDRILTVLNRMELPCRISPEKIIIYGFFFLGIVAFVNWFLSFTIIIIKPVLYAVLMLVAVRPELMKFITNDSTVIKIIETLKCFFGAIAGGILDLVQGKIHSLCKSELKK
ncbi:UNVERIFIED_CONTAM: hypothetical protein PYX00_003665 [Menopon gallinae]|uniref:Uncharacterized protein n=1 Tax=Menopon gallinae TaxID=328185 RepID=A0AAW2I0U6_9NEOP